ncbi:MAG: LAGLIDADG family homing endonuclease [Candidatus Hadarchaeaceae archaeon]
MYQTANLSIFPDTFYLRLDPAFRNELFNDLILAFDGITNAARKLDIHCASLIEWKNGIKCLPLKVFRLIAQLLNKPLYEMEKGVIGVKASRYCKDTINLKFPIKINEDWAYLSELIRTDGHINRSNQIFIVNTNVDVIRCANQLFVQVGVPNNKVKIHQRKDRTFVVSVLNVTLGSIFSTLFQIPRGNKSGFVRIPEFISKSPYIVRCAALRGTFDGDGAVDVVSKQIDFRSKNTKYLEDIKHLLKSFGINSHVDQGGERQRLRISHELNIRKFQTLIGFNHSKRKQKLAKLLSSYKFHMSPYGKAKEVILKTIAELGKCSRFQIAKKIQKHPDWVKNLLRELLQLSLVAVDKHKLPYVYSLTQNGTTFLEEVK